MASPKHQLIANKLGRLFDECLDKLECSCQVYQPIDVKIKDDTVVNPDLLIVYTEIEGHFLDKPFLLAVEILSSSTEVKDKVTKFSLYQDFGIKYYVIVDPENSSFIIYTLNHEGKYLEQKESIFNLDNECVIDVDIQKAIAAQ